MLPGAYCNQLVSLKVGGFCELWGICGEKLKTLLSKLLKIGRSNELSVLKVGIEPTQPKLLDFESS